jgi:hypothetical protein
MTFSHDRDWKQTILTGEQTHDDVSYVNDPATWSPSTVSKPYRKWVRKLQYGGRRTSGRFFTLRVTCTALPELVVPPKASTTVSSAPRPTPAFLNATAAFANWNRA